MKSSKLNILRDLVSGLWRYAWGLFVVMLIVACTEAFGLSLLFPLLSALTDQGEKFGFVAKYIDFFINNPDDTKRLFVLLSALIILFLFKSVFLIVHNGMSAFFAMKLREQWSHKILSSYMGSEYKFIMNEKQGTMFHNTLIEPFRVSKAIIDLLQLTSKIMIAVAIFAMLMLVNWKITMVITSLGALLLLGIKNSTFNYSLRFGQKRLRVNQEASDIASESISAIKEIKLIGKEEWYKSVLLEKLSIFTRIHTSFSIFTNLPDNLLELFFIVVIAIVILSLEFVYNVSVNSVIDVLGFYMIVGQRLFKYTTLIISQRMKITSSLPSLKLIHALIDKEVLKQEVLDKGSSFDMLDGDIIIKNLKFSYDPSRPVFQDLNMSVKKNKMTAIVGPSGSGKSTIADLLMRILTPDSGNICINGKSIHDFSLASWREKIGYVSQEPFLFNMSIKDNVLMGKDDATDMEIKNACKVANIQEFIENLDEGYDTIVGDRGVKLSGGQRQRIVIARAVIRKPELFIFDEATSALDAESEAKVQESINNLIGKSTILVIAHRLSTIERADYVFDLGELKSKDRSRKNLN